MRSIHAVQSHRLSAALLWAVATLLYPKRRTVPLLAENPRIPTDMSTALDDPRIVEFDVRTDEMLVNMGPQHPSTHGVLRLGPRPAGGGVSEVRPAIGSLPRCAG